MEGLIALIVFYGIAIPVLFVLAKLWEELMKR